ncbi:MAG: hypothetical protein EP311_10470 [Cytophagales bacterium]|uniref:DUF2065 domain-containing protein n=1 Tax=Algoriphagus taiwanensis TaxID=1445656 RepID=A0ABQ6PUX2_9BACT|nr:MAG: hypothetical protein EP311_10470 [Cytophagales bacterium]GMQ31766.1 hypothetical protein Ataiwa_00380 [Algoriphagus taiwanensis]
MVEAFRIILIGLFLYSSLSLILGLIRPVLVLWFLDRFNRLLVIKFYGFLMLILGALLILLYLVK